MKFVFLICVAWALLQSRPARADCTLAFAPPDVRLAASEHYYRAWKRDAPAPGRLSPARSIDNESPHAFAVIPADARERIAPPLSHVLESVHSAPAESTTGDGNADTHAAWPRAFR